MRRRTKTTPLKCWIYYEDNGFTKYPLDQHGRLQKQENGSQSQSRSCPRVIQPTILSIIVKTQTSPNYPNVSISPSSPLGDVVTSSSSPSQSEFNDARLIKFPSASELFSEPAEETLPLTTELDSEVPDFPFGFDFDFNLGF
jgi:hypothetical protein